MEVMMLAKLQFELATPTAGFLLQHLAEVEDERDWPHDLARHMVEMVLCDSNLSQLRPTEIAHAVYEVIQGCDNSVLRAVTLACPKCEPNSCDDRNYDFIENCFKQVSACLVKT